jgi:predicted nucleotidyltransferase
MSESAVRQELLNLTRLDLVTRRRDGNRVYHVANKDHPLFRDIRQIVLKTIGLADQLRACLSKDSIKVAFVFGSIATREENSRSDVDLMVIGKIGLRQLTNLLRGISEQVGREINPHIMTEEEYVQRVRAQDHFVSHVLKGPKMFIIGTEHEFEAMGK